MGKQSSRLIYQGKDHKDIFFMGKYHDAMYKGNTLVWEKIYPDKFFTQKTGTAGCNGIRMVDVKEKYIADRLYSGEGLDVFGMLLVGKVIVASFVPERNEECILVYSKDGKVWKKIDDEIEAVPDFYSAVALNEKTFAISYRKIGEIHWQWHIFNFDDDWGEVEHIKTEYDIGYEIAQGYGKRYAFYNSDTVNFVDTSGALERTYKIEEQPEERGHLYNLNEDIWMIGYSNKYGSGARYKMTVLKLDKVQSKFVRMRYYSDGEHLMSGSYMVYADESEIVVFVPFMFSRGNRSQLKYGVYSITRTGFEEKNWSELPIHIMDARTGEEKDIYTGNTILVPSETYAVSARGLHCSPIYFDGKKFGQDKANGLYVYGEAMYGDEERTRIEAAVYFDNIYLKESDGNFLIVRGEPKIKGLERSN